MALNKIRRGQSYLTHARVWYLIDANHQFLAPLTQHISRLLSGKYKPIYHHQADNGDHIVVVNTKHVVLPGDKWETEMYRHHTGYPGGFKEYKAKDLHSRNPTVLVWRNVYRLLSKDRHRLPKMERLHLFPENEHPYEDRIYLKLQALAPIPKKLEEYTPEEIKKYPKLF